MDEKYQRLTELLIEEDEYTPDQRKKIIWETINTHLSMLPEEIIQTIQNYLYTEVYREEFEPQYHMKLVTQELEIFFVNMKMCFLRKITDLLP